MKKTTVVRTWKKKRPEVQIGRVFLVEMLARLRLNKSHLMCRNHSSYDMNQAPFLFLSKKEKKSSYGLNTKILLDVLQRRQTDNL